MDIISYRGPGTAGGVSSGLERVWKEQSGQRTSWFYTTGGKLLQLTDSSECPLSINLIDPTVVASHYSSPTADRRQLGLRVIFHAKSNSIPLGRPQYWQHNDLLISGVKRD